MALKPCAECKRDISTQAKTCPHCGAPVKSGGAGWGTMLVLATIALVIILAVSNRDSSPPPSGAASKPIDKSPITQQRRREFLSKLHTNEIFGRYECRDGAATVWVKPAFYSLEFADKQSFVGVVWAFCFTADERAFVTLRDSLSGKDVGTYWGDRGLDLK